MCVCVCVCVCVCAHERETGRTQTHALIFSPEYGAMPFFDILMLRNSA